VVLTSMTGYGEGLYQVPSDGRRVRVDLRTDEGIERHGWDPVWPETGERLVPCPTPESADLQCRNVYALSKRYQEELALALGSTYGFPVVCLRLFNVYGPRQSLSNPYTGVIAIFLSRLLAGERPLVYEDGLQSRDFVSVHDAASAIVTAMSSTAADGQVLNIGSGIGRPISEVATTLAALLGRPDLPPIVSDRYRRGDIRHCIADITRAGHVLGYRAGVAWEDGLAEVVDWARSSPSADRIAQAQDELEARGLVGARRTAPESAPAS
jgi:dTDP-L-rhamnose 4-epimerase